MACFENSIQHYTAKINELTQGKYKDLYTEEFVEKILKSELPTVLKYQYDVRDFEDCAMKALMIAYAHEKIHDKVPSKIEDEVLENIEKLVPYLNLETEKKRVSGFYAYIDRNALEAVNNAKNTTNEPISLVSNVENVSDTQGQGKTTSPIQLTSNVTPKDDDSANLETMSDEEIEALMKEAQEEYGVGEEMSDEELAEIAKEVQELSQEQIDLNNDVEMSDEELKALVNEAQELSQDDVDDVDVNDLPDVDVNDLPDIAEGLEVEDFDPDEVEGRTDVDLSEIKKSNNQENKQDEKTVNKEKENKETKPAQVDKTNKDIITTSQIDETQIHSNAKISTLFNNTDSNLSFDDMLAKGFKQIIVLTTDGNELREIKEKVKGKDVTLVLNPTKSKLKQLIKANPDVCIYKSEEFALQSVDSLFKNTKIEVDDKQETPENIFMRNSDLVLYSNLINYLYNKFRIESSTMEENLGKVFATIAGQYNHFTNDNVFDKEKEIEVLGTLINNWDYITSIISINEIDNIDNIDDILDIEDEESMNQDDALWAESHTTSTMPKDGFLLAFLSSVETGKTDELGTPLCFDPLNVNNVLLRILSGAKNVEDMIRKLKEYPYNRIANYTLDKINKDKSGRLASILYTKYSNLYISQYITCAVSVNEEGEETFKVINSNKSARGELTLDAVGDEIKQNKYYLLNKQGMVKNYLGEILHNLNNTIAITDGKRRGIQRIKDDTERSKQLEELHNEYERLLMDWLPLVGVSIADMDFKALTLNQCQIALNDIYSLYYYARKLTAKKQDISSEEFLKAAKMIYENMNNNLAVITEDKTEAQVRNGGVTKFVFADKNYIDGMIENFNNTDIVEREKYMRERFLQYDWFTAEPTTELEVEREDVRDEIEENKYSIYSPLLAAIYEGKHKLECKTFLAYNANGVSSKYEELTPSQLEKIVREMFYSERNLEYKADGGDYVWVHSPVYADSGTLHFYKVPRMYNENFVPTIKNLIIQEINRIKTCKERAALIKDGKLKPIDKFDTTYEKDENGKLVEKKGRGEQFCNFPVLNSVGADNIIATIDAFRKNGDNAGEINYLNSLAVGVIKTVLHSEMYSDLQNTSEQQNTAIEQLQNVRTESDFMNYVNSDEAIRQAAEYYLTNYIRQIEIIQLTVTDPALYKNTIDLFKRYKEVNAGYTRPNTDSKYGRKYMRTIFLKDNEISLSKKDLDDMEKRLRAAAKRDNVNLDVDEIMKAFRKINVADAQSYRTLSSYRAVRDMFGQWTDKDNNLYHKIIKGEKLDANDYNQIWQTLKPFVYTQQNMQWADENGNVRNQKVGYQYKNSERLLLGMYMLFGGNKPTVLSELNRFMEKYQIDTAQFESAVKVGNQGLIDLNNVAPEDVFSYLEKQTGVLEEQKIPCKGTDQNGNVLKGNPEVIHEIPYSEYGIKTSTPVHLFDVEQQLGSQMKKILQGDIPNDAPIYIDISALGNNKEFIVNGEKIAIEQDKDGNYYLKKDQFLKLYNAVQTSKIIDSFGDVQRVFRNNQTFSHELTGYMASSPKYDFDIKQAVKTDKNGKFLTSLRHPSISHKLTQLISSIPKNKLNKQTTRGGTAIQCACWGGDDLQIKYKDDGSIEYMECYMPAYSKKMISLLMDENGVLDINKVKDDNLLKLLCYRVPSEDIYSAIPLKVKGFLPMQGGTNIMLPKEITTLTGSDFDVDKMYMLLPDFQVTHKVTIEMEEAQKRFRKDKEAQKELDEKIKKEIAKRFDEKPDKIKKEVYNRLLNEWLYKNGLVETDIEYIKFDNTKDVFDNDTNQKNNLLLSLMRSVLTSPHTTTKSLNPGGFDRLKTLANTRGAKQPNAVDFSIKQYITTYNNYMTGKKLIGIYANHNSSHAICQGQGLKLNTPMNINGRLYSKFDEEFDTDRHRISRNIAEFLAASVDNAKDPVLAKLWQNDKTASFSMFLIRLGVPVDTLVDLYRNAAQTDPDLFNEFMDRGKVNGSKENPVPLYDSTKSLIGKNFFAAINYYYDTVRNIETLCKLTKTDSVNGAIFDLPNVISTQIRFNKLFADEELSGVKNIIPNFKEDKEIFDKKKKDLIKEFGNLKPHQMVYYLTWRNYKQYFKNVYDEKFIDEIVSLFSECKSATEKDIRAFINEYNNEKLKYLAYFRPRVIDNADGSIKMISTEDIKNATKQQVPKRLTELRNKYPDSKFIKALQTETVKNEEVLVVKKSSSMRAGAINQLKADFEQLYFTPESHQDALDLLYYCLSVNGFGFSPQSFINLIPLSVLKSIDGIEQITDYIEMENLEDFEDRFIKSHGLAVNKNSVPNKKVKEGVIKARSNGRYLVEYSREGAMYYKKTGTDKEGWSYYAQEDYANSTKADIVTILHDIDENATIEAMDKFADYIIRELNESGNKYDELSKETILEILKKNNEAKKMFSFDENPLDNYEPINVEWC